MTSPKVTCGAYQFSVPPFSPCVALFPWSGQTFCHYISLHCMSPTHTHTHTLSLQPFMLYVSPPSFPGKKMLKKREKPPGTGNWYGAADSGWCG